MFGTSTLISALLLASSVVAQRYTTTLPYVDGDTLVVSAGTNAAGLATTATLQTLTAGAAATTPALTTARTTARTTTPAAADDDDETTTPTTRRATTTQRNIQGISTDSYAPMRTTTYWLDPGDGVYTAYTWTAPTTTLPQVPTANVPAGTIQDYQSYQSNVNSVVLESAQNALASSTGKSAGRVRAQPMFADGAAGGWVTLVVGAVGAGLGVLAL